MLTTIDPRNSSRNSASFTPIWERDMMFWVIITKAEQHVGFAYVVPTLGT